MLKNTLVTVGIVAALALGVVNFGRPSTIEVNVPPQATPIVNVAAPNVNVPATVVNVPKQEQNAILGAVPTLDGVQYPYVNINGLRQMYYSQQAQATSSIICSVLNPFGTTTALNSFKFRGTNLMGAQIVDVATSSSRFGTSSPFFIKGAALPAGRFDLVWGGASATTTNANLVGMNATPTGVSDVIIRGTEYLNVRVATGTPGTFAGGYIFQGVCGGVFEL